MANTPINAMTATFGTGDQTAIKMNVTDSGPSDNLSKLMDLQVGGNSKFNVTKEGYVTATNYTGSFSGSIIVTDSTALATTTYPIFVDGSGRRVLRTDSTGLQYDPSTNQLLVVGDILTGGNLDSTNSPSVLLQSPSSVTVAPNASTIFIGKNSSGTKTAFVSKQVTALSFTGSFTGSFSGSRMNFTKVSGSNARFVNRVVATSFTGSFSGSLVKTGNFTGSKALFSKNVIANSFTGSINGTRAEFSKITGSNGYFTKNVVADSFTGSFKGTLADFSNITASKIFVLDNVISPSYTGSISGSVFVKSSTSLAGYSNIIFAGGNNKQILRTDNGGLRYNAATDDLDVGNTVYAGTSFETNNIVFTLLSNPQSITFASNASELIVGDSATNTYTKFLSRLVLARSFTGSFTGSISGSRARFSGLTSSNARIIGRVNATSFTGSITGTRGFFTRITSSTARFTIKATAPEFTGSISGDKGIFVKLSGSNARIIGRVNATSFTGSFSGSLGKTGNFTGSKALFTKIISQTITSSISGSIGYFNRLTSSNQSVLNKSTANYFSGSRGAFTKLTGSELVIYNTAFANFYTSSRGYFNKLTGSNAKIFGRVIATSFTGSISGSLATFDTVKINKISASISGSKGYFGTITASKLNVINSIKAPSFTGSFSGSFYVQSDTGTNQDYNLIFTIGGDSGPKILKFDGSTLTWNPFSNLLTTNGALTVGGSISSTADPVTLFGTNSTINIGSTATSLTLGNVSTDHIKIKQKSVNITGSLKIKTAITASQAGASGNLFISGAGALQGYMGIMIDGVKYKIPLYAWS